MMGGICLFMWCGECGFCCYESMGWRSEDGVKVSKPVMSEFLVSARVSERTVSSKNGMTNWVMFLFPGPDSTGIRSCAVDLVCGKCVNANQNPWMVGGRNVLIPFEPSNLTSIQISCDWIDIKRTENPDTRLLSRNLEGKWQYKRSQDSCYDRGTNVSVFQESPHALEIGIYGNMTKVYITHPPTTLRATPAKSPGQYGALK